MKSIYNKLKGNVYIIYTFLFAIVFIAIYGIFIKTGKTMIWDKDRFISTLCIFI